jgi:hypothetical protein
VWVHLTMGKIPGGERKWRLLYIRMEPSQPSQPSQPYLHTPTPTLCHTPTNAMWTLDPTTGPGRLPRPDLVFVVPFSVITEIQTVNEDWVSSWLAAWSKAGAQVEGNSEDDAKKKYILARTGESHGFRRSV